MYLPKKKFYEIFKYVPRLASDGVVINSRKEILLVKRNHAPYKNCWALPGGFVEKGETVEEACIRECFEETGIKTKAVKLTGVYSDPRRDPRGHVVGVPFLLKPLGSKTRTSNETSDVKFFPLNKMPKKLAADHGKIIKDAVKAFKKFNYSERHNYLD